MSSSPLTPRKALFMGRAMMTIAIAGMLASAALAYVYADHFSIPAQVAGHLALPISAGVFKLGYVVRLAAHNAMGNWQAG
ncbi:hypothetical protein [uncultured Aquitalea sp.]|uniref:hypothetical protein n=1 Tax=uncultured Aquitalea sp. TaxID=540272 RepID=UPI0025CDEEE7|nr:hypothetical protein [uncultured Aquitalea sp.]